MFFYKVEVKVECRGINVLGSLLRLKLSMALRHATFDDNPQKPEHRPPSPTPSPTKRPSSFCPPTTPSTLRRDTQNAFRTLLPQRTDQTTNATALTSTNKSLLHNNDLHARNQTPPPRRRLRDPLQTLRLALQNTLERHTHRKRHIS